MGDPREGRLYLETLPTKPIPLSVKASTHFLKLKTSESALILPRSPTCLCCCCSVTQVMSHIFVTPWIVALQAPLCMGFSKQEYWSGLPFPSPGDLPDPGIELRSLALQAVSCISVRFFTDCATREILSISYSNSNQQLSPKLLLCVHS